MRKKLDSKSAIREKATVHDEAVHTACTQVEPLCQRHGHFIKQEAVQPLAGVKSCRDEFDFACADNLQKQCEAVFKRQCVVTKTVVRERRVGDK